jgi:hypothetical protein
MASIKGSPICLIERFPHQPSGRKGVGILIFPENRDVTARAGYDGLGEKQRWINKGIDWWVSGATLPKHRGHGWDKSQYGGKYVHCFVFETSDSDRMYGFLCHPKRDDPSFLFCVLVAYIPKHQWETDEAMLQVATRMRDDLSVRQALMKLFSDSSGDRNNGKSHHALDRKKRR